jgi:hypothetical protein
MIHADKSFRRFAAHDCRGVRRIHPVKYTADVSKLPSSAYLTVCAWLIASHKKSVAPVEVPRLCERIFKLCPHFFLA